MSVFARYWERGGKIQWIAEGHPEAAIGKPTCAVDRFRRGGGLRAGRHRGQWGREGRLDLLGKCVQFMKSKGVPGGVGAHMEVIMESERREFGADFYVKTLHHTRYWSARRPDQTQDVIDNVADNYWDRDPERTIAS